MASTFLSPEWISLASGELTGDEDVREAATAWPFGPILLLATPDGEHLAAEAGLVIDITGGGLTGVRALEGPPALVPTAFGGGLARWRSVLAGELGMLDGVLQARLTFRGDLPAVSRHAALFSAIAAALGRMAADTSWQDVPASDAEPARA